MNAAKQTVINEVYILNFIFSADLTFRVIRQIDFIRAELHAKKLIFLTPFPTNKMDLFFRI